MKSVPETPAPSVISDVSAPDESLVTPVETSDPLMAEVETFLSKREELARRFAEEIEATEERLAELKRTAASLFGENDGKTANEKPKKPKPKPAAKSDSVITAEATPASE